MLTFNINRRFFLSSSIALGAFAAFSRVPVVGASLLQNGDSNQTSNKGINKVIKTDEEWKRILTPDQYAVTRQKGTEPPFTSPLNHIHQQGVFECVCCELPLFSSKAKFDSGTGWPSLTSPLN